MKTLTVREVPEEVYAAIRRDAKSCRRSIQEQVRYVLAKEAQLREGRISSSARLWRGRLKTRAQADCVGDIRAARARR